MLKNYYRLAKPGIVYGNLLSSVAGFLFASRWHIHVVLFLATMIGTALVIGSACVFNNYIDRNLDKHMKRTSKRALVAGTISVRAALTYGSVLSVIGFLLLILYTNYYVVFIGAVGFIVYIIFYGLSKRQTVHGTLVGSIAGAAPIVAGYCAVSDRFNSAALILFLIMACWQMPHFYSIALFRYDDYKVAGLPVLPVKKSPKAAKIQIVFYVILFTILVTLLSAFGYMGFWYLAVMLAVSFLWIKKSLRDWRVADVTVWARGMFKYSLTVLLVFSVMLAVGPLLP